jgi:hypothetical protein
MNEDGSNFWADKKMPHSIDFDSNNELHLTFIMSCAQLIAIVNNIHIPSNEDQQKHVIDVINSISIPEFIPKRNKTILTDASVTAPIDNNDHEESQAIDELKRQTYSKDDDLQLKCIYTLAVSHYLFIILKLKILNCLTLESSGIDVQHRNGFDFRNANNVS